jgi:RND family efflux transporter MFP subunit
MTQHSRLTLSWSTLALAALALVAAAATTTWLVMRASDERTADHDSHDVTSPTPTAPDSGAAAGPMPSPDNRAPLPDLIVTLSEEAVARAGIVATPVIAGEAASRLRLPGVVEPHAYRQVAVTPLVAGRVTRISAELGDRVRKGQTLAEVFSPELSEAQTQYLNFAADLEAVHQQLRRTERLAEIGAASKQELERVRAEHVAHTTHVDGTRAKLVLFGMTPEQIAQLTSTTEVTATVQVPAPIDGVVTERAANAGLNVDAAAKLFTIVDLSSVWIVGDLYEQDFAQVKVGSPASITTTAYPDVTLHGRVSYIDPQLNPQTRTSKVRVEVGNADGRLRLGMYADVLLGEATGAQVGLVPRKAIQNVGDRQVVYLVRPQARGQFVEREVRVGRSMGEQVEILAGVQPGDSVVSDGSFFVRAEAERQRQRPAGTSDPVQTAKLTITSKGFEPSALTLRAGVPARISVLRTTDDTCAKEMVIPAFNIKRALPLNTAVDVEFTPDKAGELTFLCGMDMLHGTITVR